MFNDVSRRCQRYFILVDVLKSHNSKTFQDSILNNHKRRETTKNIKRASVLERRKLSWTVLFDVTVNFSNGQIYMCPETSCRQDRSWLRLNVVSGNRLETPCNINIYFICRKKSMHLVSQALVVQVASRSYWYTVGVGIVSRLRLLISYCFFGSFDV